MKKTTTKEKCQKFEKTTTLRDIKSLTASEGIVMENQKPLPTLISGRGSTCPSGSRNKSCRFYFTVKLFRSGNMESSSRYALKDALFRYVSATLVDMRAVNRFCEGMLDWQLRREKEINAVVDITERVEPKMGKNILVYVKNKVTAERRRVALEAELAVALRDVPLGLEELEVFVEALERLAGTSPLIFRDEVIKLPRGVRDRDVAVTVNAARQAGLLAAGFKQDADVFFAPTLDNADVLAYLLEKYGQTALQMCLLMDKSKLCLDAVSDYGLDVRVELPGKLSPADAQRMLCHIHHCERLRNDTDFRLVFLLQEEACHRFLAEFRKCQPRMMEFLDQLDHIAEDQVRKNKAVRISNVASSSMGVVSGALSIAGLALIPITAGTSLALTMTGLGLALVSWGNSAVATAVDYVLERKSLKKSGEVIENFIRDAQRLDDVAGETRRLDAAVSEVLCEVPAVRRGGCVRDAATALKTPKRGKEVATRLGKVVVVGGKALRNVHKVAADARNAGQAALKVSVAASRAAKAGLIPLNGLFVGIDIAIICTNGAALAKGCETRASCFLRARSAFWRAEMESWQRMSDSLARGLATFEENRAVLEAPIYRANEMNDRQCCVT
ncbi:uncharacterized protein apol [Stigmatopora argus]